MAPISDHPRSGSTAVGTAGGTQTPGMGDNTSGFSILGISGRRLAAVLIGWFFVVFDGHKYIHKFIIVRISIYIYFFTFIVYFS